MHEIPLKNRLSRDLVRGLLGGAVAAGGFAATLLSSAPHASAQSEAFGDLGVFAGYTWGEGGGFTFGVEARGGAFTGEGVDSSCGGTTLVMSAGVARFSIVDFGHVRLGAAAQIGANVGPTAALADFGLGYRWGERGGVSVPIGLDLQVWGLTTMVNIDPLLRDGFVGGGFRYPTLDREIACVVEGRPLHGEHGRCPLPAMRALAPIGSRSEREVALASEWSRRARAEWASVPAFVQLADQLRAVGAPAAFITRSIVAANDEVRHAIATAALASRSVGAPLSLDAVSATTREAAMGRRGIVRLAIESWLDGCLGEGFAAEKAAFEARCASDGSAREAHRTIAVEEASHAELAWDVLAWAIARGGDDVRHALFAHRNAQVTYDADESDRDAQAVAAHGIADGDACARIADVSAQRARSRLHAMLAA